MRRGVLLIAFTALVASVGGYSSRTSCLGAAERDPYTFRMEEDQIVLYTVHRGDRETIRKAVNDLYALAETKGIRASSPFTLVALNNPLQPSREHVLTEIRIPVDPNALTRAGRLGPMTDVKRVLLHEVAVPRRRSRGNQTDRNRLAMNIYDWLRNMRRIPMFGWRETFFGDYRAQDYDQMDVEITVPVLGTSSVPSGK
jgi:effector-binding domain-containing protein